MGAALEKIIADKSAPTGDHDRPSVSPPAGIIRHHDFCVGESLVFQAVYNVSPVIPVAKYLAGAAYVIVMVFRWEQMLNLLSDKNRPLDRLGKPLRGALT